MDAQEAEWDATFNRPDVAGLMHLANQRHTGSSPDGTEVVVNASGNIVEVTPGSTDLPATAASNIVQAANHALDAWEAATQRYLEQDAAIPADALEEPQTLGEPGNVPVRCRVENDEGTVVATVDAESMRLAELFLADLSEATIAAIPATTARAFAKARGTDGLVSLDESLQATMDELTEALAGMQSQLDLINDRLRSAEQGIYPSR